MTTGDADIIDSFALYCNRERNITPVMKTDVNTASITIDLLLHENTQFTYQIAAIGKDAKWVGGFLQTPPLYLPSLSVATKG